MRAEVLPPSHPHCSVVDADEQPIERAKIGAAHQVVEEIFSRMIALFDTFGGATDPEAAHLFHLCAKVRDLADVVRRPREVAERVGVAIGGIVRIIQ